MSEPMLTRGQLLNLKKEPPDEYPEWIWEKLCTMALSSIAMREALEAEGWKLVPIEPTMEMIEAGRPRPPNWDKTPFSKRLREGCDAMRRRDWAEMLSAAPEYPISLRAMLSEVKE